MYIWDSIKDTLKCDVMIIRGHLYTWPELRTPSYKNNYPDVSAVNSSSALLWEAICYIELNIEMAMVVKWISTFTKTYWLINL